MAAPLKNLGKNVKQALSGTDPKDDISDLIFIYPRVFWMTFPSKEKIKDLAACLNDQFKKSGYYIWNLSEHTYDTNYFNNQVVDPQTYLYKRLLNIHSLDILVLLCNIYLSSLNL
jgi:hypothetical protein